MLSFKYPKYKYKNSNLKNKIHIATCICSFCLQRSTKDITVFIPLVFFDVSVVTQIDGLDNCNDSNSKS